MKFLLAIVLAACAAPQTHVNVAHVRDDIGDVIAHDNSNPRSIVSMGHTTNDAATVFTQNGASRHEESWVHSATGWTLANTKDSMR
jgi:hypothetical protein